jgi:hypothetical protein
MTLCALLLAVAAPAAAQPAPAPASAPSPEAVALAKELVRLADTRATLDRTMAQSLGDMRSGKALSTHVDRDPNVRMQRARNPAAWDAALARLGVRQAGLLEAAMTEIVPLVEERSVAVYAERFTLDELPQLIAFYDTPVGKLVLEKVPLVTSDIMVWLNAELPKRMAPMMETLAPEIERELTPLLAK